MTPDRLVEMVPDFESLDNRSRAIYAACCCEHIIFLFDKLMINLGSDSHLCKMRRSIDVGWDFGRNVFNDRLCLKRLEVDLSRIMTMDDQESFENPRLWLMASACGEVVSAVASLLRHIEISEGTVTSDKRPWAIYCGDYVVRSLVYVVAARLGYIELNAENSPSWDQIAKGIVPKDFNECLEEYSRQRHLLDELNASGGRLDIDKIQAEHRMHGILLAKRFRDLG